ncbi:Na-translocating system protein MpsC family protein [Bacillus marinisedimentorum]|uniref:Na-translocating system protein MpsC family protein n=1 Tax=Bacillus marinisedimentorum TaxID=1821260 RepID=UPI0007DFA358|nr:Na-translocating system protein MpsC family protein [Bacillus marinisedimentorum]
MAITNEEKALGSFTGRLLREHFGKGPGGVYATIAPPYITVYIKDFLAPMEHKLLDNEQSKYVQKIRDMLMPTLEEEVRAYISVHLSMEMQEFYYDWNLNSHSGILVGITDTDHDHTACSYSGQKEIHSEIIEISQNIQKAPDEIFSCMPNPRTLLVTRHQILIAVEKELIQQGFAEQLTIAKRNLEKRRLSEHNDKLQAYLSADIEEAFVSWNYPEDKSVQVFIIKPHK